VTEVTEATEGTETEVIRIAEVTVVSEVITPDMLMVKAAHKASTTSTMTTAFGLPQARRREFMQLDVQVLTLPSSLS